MALGMRRTGIIMYSGRSEEFGILDISSSIRVDGFEGCARNRIDKFKVVVVQIKNKGKEGNGGGERVVGLCWRRMRKSTKLGLKGGGHGDHGGAGYCLQYAEF
jgi:hypothetical protein